MPEQALLHAHEQGDGDGDGDGEETIFLSPAFYPSNPLYISSSSYSFSSSCFCVSVCFCLCYLWRIQLLFSMAPDSAPSPWPSAAHLQKLKDAVAAMLDEPISGKMPVAVSPYRICPLGAHIDHQGGSVTAMALDLGVLLAFVTSDKGCMHLRSEQFEGEVRFCIEEFADEREAVMERESNWGDYARGAVMALRLKGYKLDRGIVGVVDGSKGFHSCGISSSAALGVAFLLALEHANGLVVSKSDNVELGRMIENGYLGLRSGVLDQSAILLSQRHCLTLIRCANFGHEIIYPPWQQEGSKFKILLAFSGLRHALASQPGYNLRVDECRQAASILLNATGRGMVDPILGNITEEEYYSLKEKLQGGLAKRAEHFFSENARVVKGVNAWASGDLDTFGKLMSESGQSSIENYECGSEPLIQLRAILLKAPGVFGARFSGAGFRGFCAALVASDKAEEAAAYVEKEYKLVQPQLSKNVAGARAVIICNTGDSAHLLLV